LPGRQWPTHKFTRDKRLRSSAAVRRALATAGLSFVAGAGVVAFMMLLGRAPTGKVVPGGVPSPPSPGDTALGLEPGGTAPVTSEDVLTSPPSPATGALDIELTGVNDHWHIRYLGWAGRLNFLRRIESTCGENSSGTVYLPAASDVRIHLRSRDFIYLLSLPQLNKKQIAVPGRVFLLAFRTGARGTLVFRCDHLCGRSRPALTLAAVIQPEPVFRAWFECRQAER